MEVTLSQENHFCPLKATIGSYQFEGRDGIKELTETLEMDVTPFVSYFASSHLAGIDGVGTDGMGPCVRDTPEACPDTVRFYGFSIEDIKPDEPDISSDVSEVPRESDESSEVANPLDSA